MRAVFYLRQSLDRQEGIDNQLDRCRAMAAARSWEEVGIYIDNDTSASKDRGEGTAWARLLADFKAGRFDIVVAVQMDRVIRRVADIQTLIDMGAKMATVDGEIDLSTPQGEFNANLGASLARLEVRRKGERQQRANEYRAHNGERVNARRAFGYERDNSLNSVEADALRAVYAGFLGGASLRSLTAQLTRAEFPTTQGAEWKPAALRKVLMNPRNAALMRYKGELIGAAKWEPIVSAEIWEATVAKLNNPARNARASVPAQTKYLLSGIALCGVCGATVNSGGLRKGQLTYRCSASNVHITRRADHIEALVIANVLELLAKGRPQVEPLEGQESIAELHISAQKYRDQLDGLAVDYAEQILTREQVGVASRRLRAKLAEVNAEIAAVSHEDALTPLLGHDDLTAAFEEMSTEEKRRVIGGLFKITLHTVKASGPKFNPETVSIEPL